MKQQAVRRRVKTTMRVVKSLKAVTAPNPNEATEKLVNSAWNFAFTALWNNSVFSKTEIATAKASISEFLAAFKDKERGYSIFCQRVLLARQYVMAQPNRFIPLPSLWLDKNNITGFAGTKEWYNNIKAVRISLPNFKTELRAFAEAVLEMSQDPTNANFHYWRNYFIEKKTTGLLSLFLQTIANEQFGL